MTKTTEATDMIKTTNTTEATGMIITTNTVMLPPGADYWIGPEEYVGEFPIRYDLFDTPYQTATDKRDAVLCATIEREEDDRAIELLNRVDMAYVNQADWARGFAKSYAQEYGKAKESLSWTHGLREDPGMTPAGRSPGSLERIRHLVLEEGRQVNNEPTITIGGRINAERFLDETASEEDCANSDLPYYPTVAMTYSEMTSMSPHDRNCYMGRFMTAGGPYHVRLVLSKAERAEIAKPVSMTTTAPTAQYEIAIPECATRGDRAGLVLNAGKLEPRLARKDRCD